MLPCPTRRLRSSSLFFFFPFVFCFPNPLRGAEIGLPPALMNKQLDVLSNAIFVTRFTSGFDLSSLIKVCARRHPSRRCLSVFFLFCFFFLICPRVLFRFLCVCVLHNAKSTEGSSTSSRRAERLCSGCARGPDSLGTGSVGGFWRLEASGKSYPQGAPTERLDSYWNRAPACVCVRACVRVCISGIGICVAPSWTP